MNTGAGNGPSPEFGMARSSFTGVPPPMLNAGHKLFPDAHGIPPDAEYHQVFSS